MRLGTAEARLAVAERVIARIPSVLMVHEEALTFEVTEIDENSGTISISWGSTSVSFNLTNI